MYNTTKQVSAVSVSPQFDIVAIVTALMGLLGSSVSSTEIAASLQAFWGVFSLIAYVLSAVLLYGVVYSMVRFDQLSDEEHELLREAEHAFNHAHGHAKGGQRWEDILRHVGSENPNDWRLAIIEADIMLEEALNRNGYLGASIGDKLKGANPDSFKTLQDAWSAHKVRNQIAHQGSDFVLTKRITQEAINQYERVFEELGTF